MCANAFFFFLKIASFFVWTLTFPFLRMRLNMPTPKICNVCLNLISVRVLPKNASNEIHAAATYNIWSQIGNRFRSPDVLVCVSMCSFASCTEFIAFNDESMVSFPTYKKQMKKGSMRQNALLTFFYVSSLCALCTLRRYANLISARLLSFSCNKICIHLSKKR